MGDRDVGKLGDSRGVSELVGGETWTGVRR